MTWDRLSALGPHVVDAGLLVGIGLLVLVDLLTAPYQPAREVAPKLLLSATAAVAVAVRRRWPVGSVIAMATAITMDALGSVPGGTASAYPAVAPIAALGALATPVVRHQPLTRAVAATVVGGLAIGAVLLTSRNDYELVFFLVLFAGTYAIGVGAGMYLRDLDRQQREAAEAARLDERLDLARELHDLVAHYVTGIVVQAQAAGVVADRDPAAAARALDQIEGAGRDVLTAMRRLVGSLRDDGAAPVAPPVGLAGLDDLVSASSALGPAVDLTIDPASRHHLFGTVAASTHRIVQESLTNVRRHATGATRADVEVRVVGDHAVVTVTDDGLVPVGGGRPDGRGYGLVGMQERAEALGGTLTAGPVDPPGHGWQVRALLPLDVPSARALR